MFVRVKKSGAYQYLQIVQNERANGQVTVEREIEGGARQVVELSSPCLIAVQTGLTWEVDKGMQVRLPRS